LVGGCQTLQNDSGVRRDRNPNWCVKVTGSVRNTRLDSLFMEAEITCELTASLRPPGFTSASIFTVAFCVDRKEPRFL
uniref:Uncharacterized protein n=1 Tax=Astyanax mexicanus TaxID=7994 RepID=A0A3B1IL02_ASTMX